MSQPWVGVQMGAISILTEGAAHVCEYLANEGGVNAVLVGTHGGSYGPGLDDSYAGWADHGVELPPPSGKPHPSAFIPYRERYYASTPLGQMRDPAVHAWCDRDVLAETIAAAHARGMLAYARHLEVFHPVKAQQMDGWAQVMSVDCYGRKDSKPCWNHPDYRAWWLAMTEELCKEYQLDGLIYGPERDAPLGPVLHQGQAPYCFCSHCCRIGRERGIDPQRAREGWQALHRLMRDLAERDQRPRDGVFTEVLRLWIRHPEIMAWEQLQNEAKWGLHAECYGLAKVLRPSAEVGWMVPVYPLKHDPFSRAGAYDYAAMAEFSDFIKPNIYQDVNAARLRDWVDNRPLVWRDLPPRQLHALMASLLGFPEGEPDYEQAWDAPFSPAFVEAETRRCKEAVGDRCKVYAGLGVDIPHARIGPQPREATVAATRAAWVAGADGILLSREYQYMRRETLNAVRDVTAVHTGRWIGA